MSIVTALKNAQHEVALDNREQAIKAFNEANRWNIKWIMPGMFVVIDEFCRTGVLLKKEEISQENHQKWMDTYFHDMNDLPKMLKRFKKMGMKVPGFVKSMAKFNQMAEAIPEEEGDLEEITDEGVAGLLSDHDNFKATLQ